MYSIEGGEDRHKTCILQRKTTIFSLESGEPHIVYFGLMCTVVFIAYQKPTIVLKTTIK